MTDYERGRRAGIEEAERMICYGCANDHAVEKVGQYWEHPPYQTGPTPDTGGFADVTILGQVCSATKIRDAIAAREGEAGRFLVDWIGKYFEQLGRRIRRFA